MSDVYFSDSTTDEFRRKIKLSVVLHVGLFLLLAAKASLFPSEPIMVRQAIRVDVVALPDKVKSPAPAAVKQPEPVKVKEAPPKPETKPKPKTKPKVDLKATQKSQQSAINKLKAMQSIEQMKKDLAEKQAREQQFKGNVLSEGTALQGLAKVDFDRYFGEVEQRIRANWTLPGWLQEKPLKARALVQIDEQGLVTKKQILQSSGNEVFDSYVLAAIDRAAPFPAPPDRLKDVLALKGIVFNFPD